MTEDERWMEYALREAEQAYKRNEVPIGAVVILGNRIIGRGYNQIESLQDPTAHAEIIAITAAAATVEDKRLDGCTLYVTLEPCPMCAGALVLARLDRLVYGCPDPKTGACGSLYDIVRDGRLNHRLQVTAGVLAADCAALLQAFFQTRRRPNGADPA